MFKTVVHISFAVCFALAASRSSAQQAPQPVFRIVSGSDIGAANNRGNPSVAVPVLDFVLDPKGGLRPVVGVAGSAFVGVKLELGFEVVHAAVPPNHDYILATTRESNWPVLLQVSGNTVTIRPEDTFFNTGVQPSECYESPSVEDRKRSCARNNRAKDAFSKIEGIVLSPTGSVAAFFSSESEGRIYTFGSLAQSPVFLRQFEVGALSPVSAFAISDDGRTVVLGVSDGDVGSLFLITSNQAPRLVASLGHPSAIRFLHNSDTAIIADDVENKIYALSGGQIFAIASAADGISAPAGIGISNDNQKVFVGSSASGSVTTIGLNGTAVESMPCHCALTGLQPTSADSVFRLTHFSGGPISLFDGNSRAPRMIFVPVGAQF